MRAKLVYNPEEYRHSSWGYWNGTGAPPFECILEHMQRSYGEYDLTMESLEEEIRIDLLNSMAAERGYDFEDLQLAHGEARARGSASHRYLCRARYWSDGLIIGSKSFVLRMSLFIADKDKAHKKRHTSLPSDGSKLYSYRELRD